MKSEGEKTEWKGIMTIYVDIYFFLSDIIS